MSTDAITESGLRTLEAYRRNSSSGTNLNMNDFLKLFVAQLSSQDPLSSSSGSGSGTDYISQLAQLTMLEQISDVSDALSTNQAYSMIGKYVYIGERSDSNLIFGRVDGVMSDGGVNCLLVGGEAYDLSDVYAVVDEDAASMATDDEILQSANLIGKTVTASITETDDEDNETTSEVTGKVEKIVVKDGVIYLVIDGKNVPLSAITEITEAAPEAATD